MNEPENPAIEIPPTYSGRLAILTGARTFSQFFYWMAGASGDVRPFFAGGHVLEAVFNQLVRSRAQLLLLE